MDGGMVFEGSNLPGLFQNDRLPSSEILDSFWISNPCSSFHGSTSMVSFEASQGENNMIAPFFTQLDKDENVDEDFDKCFHQPEKKRRLTVDQVEFLERSFEVENKLEPDRKVQLAKELNLQPRQVAIWFQNRRARYKTKQLEKDYDFLKASYDKLKVDCGSLEKENGKLKHEVDLLMKKLLHREQGKAESEEECEPSNSTESLKPVSQNVVCKQEDANSNSGKSDVLDSESPHNTDGIHSSLLEPSADSSDFSQDINGGGFHLLRPPRFPKLEEGSYIDVTSINSCSLGYPVEDQSFWFWPN